MRKKILSVLLALCMTLSLLPEAVTVAAAASTVSGNLIQNPGGESLNGDGMLSQNGWEEDSDPKRGYSYSNIMGFEAHGGTEMMGFYCMGNPQEIASSCYQDIDPQSYLANGSVSYTLSGYITFSESGDGSGTATLKIEQFDKDGKTLSTDYRTVSSASVVAEQWTRYAVEGAVNSEAENLRVSIAAELSATGTYPLENDAFAAFDDISLILTTVVMTTPTITITATGKTYDGSAIAEPAVAGNAGNGAVSFSYSSTSDGVYATGLPIDAGTWYVKAHVAANGEYLAADSAPVAVTIGKANQPAPAQAVGYTIDYAAETISVVGGYEVSADSGFAAVVSTGSAVVPGSTLYVRSKADDNHNAGAAASFTVPARPATPGVPVLSGKTGTSVTVAAVAGQEYSRDNGASWQDGGAFSGLTAGQSCSIITRVKAVAAGSGKTFASANSGALTVTTKTAPAAGSTVTAPVIGTGENRPTSGSITINTVAGQEYYLSESDAEPSDWSGATYFKASVSGTHTFTTLSPATRYYIHARTAETDDALPSASVKIAQYTLPATPDASVVTIDYTAETIAFDDGYEVSTKNDGTGTAVTKDITPGAAAETLYVRVRAVAGGAPASEWAPVEIPARPAVGAALAVDNAAESVAIPAGYSYKIGSGGPVDVTEDTAVALGPGKSLSYWRTAKEDAFKSNSADLTAPERQAEPGVPEINGVAETLATTAAMQYKLGNGDWTNCTANMALSAFGWNGTAAVSVQLRLAATAGDYASGNITMVIPPHVVAPAVGSTDETISGKADGTLTGVENDMEYRLSADTNWTACSGTAVTGLAPGAYSIRYAAGESYDASAAADVTIAAGRKLTVTLPAVQEGYTITADKTEFDWHESVTLTFTLSRGYTKKSTFAVMAGNAAVSLDANGKAVVTGREEDFAVTVDGIARIPARTGGAIIISERGGYKAAAAGAPDTTAPTGEIIVGENRWTKFLSTVTFGLLFRETQTVTVAAADTGSGVAKAEYLLSETAFTRADKVAGTWHRIVLNSAGRGSFSLAPNSRQFIYLKITDNAGNFVIIGSDEVVLYTSAALGVSTAEFNADRPADIYIPLVLNGNAVKGVKCGGNALVGGRDYVVSKNTLTIKGAYLYAAMKGDNLKLTVSFAPVAAAAGKSVTTSVLTVVKHVHTWNGGTCTACGFIRTVPAAPAANRQTISDGTGKASVSGVLTQGAEFVLTPISGGNSYDNLIRLLDAGENNVVGVYEAAVNGKYTGSLVITFTVGAKYDGRKLTVYHEKKDGTTEAFTQIVQDGKVSVTVNELSPFLLAVARETAPAGGDAAISSASGTDAGVRSASGAYEMYVGTAVLLALGLAAVLYAVIRRRKHE